MFVCRDSIIPNMQGLCFYYGYNIEFSMFFTLLCVGSMSYYSISTGYYHEDVNVRDLPDFEAIYNSKRALTILPTHSEFYFSESDHQLITFARNYLDLNYLPKSEHILATLVFVEQHLASDTSDLVFMNPNYFSGYFKKHVGVKFKEYLTNYRINEAEKLILTTDYKVYEIAQAVGFGDYRHFREVFKKVKGQTPRDYKKRVLG